MAAEMTSKERLLGAMRSEDVDHVPNGFRFWRSPRHEMARWTSERERLAAYREWGWDAFVTVGGYIPPSADVEVDLRRETVDGETLIDQTWKTPSGTVHERLRVTDDWPAAQGEKPFVSLQDSFRTSRYVEMPFKGPDDVDTFQHLFPIGDQRQEDKLVQSYRGARELADEFCVPLFANVFSGLNAHLYHYTAEEAVVAVLEQPEMTRRMINHLDAAYTSRAELLLDLGVDGVIRSGWFESTDLWSPTIFREFARSSIEDLTGKVHRTDGVVVYLMDTGIAGLLPDLKEMAFDCLHGADPILSTDGLELDALRSSLPGKSIWGGLSGPEHFVQCTPEEMAGAVEKAFADLGRRGLVLGITVGIRDYYRRENIEACDQTWKRFRPFPDGESAG